MTEKEYGKLVEELSPKSPMGKDCAGAFVTGGIICAIGQFFINYYTKLGLDQDAAGTAASMTLVPEHWCPSLALPIPLRHRPWNSRRKGSFWV